MTQYDENNIFAKIIRKEVPAKIIFENDFIIAFNDITPAAPTHVLVAPKHCYISFDDFIDKATTQEIAEFWRGLKQVVNKLDLSDAGYRIITNHGKDADQSVPHFHVHILAGKPLGILLA